MSGGPRTGGAGWRGTGGGRRDWLRARQDSRSAAGRTGSGAGAGPHAEEGARTARPVPAREPDILFEDNHLLVIRKPVGLLSQGDATGDRSVVDWAKDYLRRAHDKPGNVFVGLVHRLDRPVSGVMVLARTSKAASRLVSQIRARTVDKTYLAVVEGRPEPAAGTLHDHLLKRAQFRRVALLDEASEDSQEAELHYTVLGTDGGCSLVEVRLVTGRSHQIRAQFAGIGHPLVGDLRYGSRVAPPPGLELALYARSLAFDHPTRAERCRFEAPSPAGWPWPPPPALVASLRATAPLRSAAARPRPAQPPCSPSASSGSPPPVGSSRTAPPRTVATGSLAALPAAALLYGDEDLLLIDKPAGLPVQPTLDPGRANLLGALPGLLAAHGLADGTTRPPTPMTRLPAAASGIVLLARTRSAARSVDAQLRAGTLRRLFLLVIATPVWPQAAGEGGDWQGPEHGCRWRAVGASRQGATLLAVETLGSSARALEDLLQARGWQPGPANLRHLLRLRLQLPGGGSILEHLAPPPGSLQAWLPSGAPLPEFPAELPTPTAGT